MPIKRFNISRFDMYAAHRAGLKTRRIAEIAGCKPDNVRYWLKKLKEDYSDDEAGFRAWIAFRRLVRHKGFPRYDTIPRPKQVHNYIFHGQWGEICPDTTCSTRKWDQKRAEVKE